MLNIKNYIESIYSLKLNDLQVEKFLEWYNSNCSDLSEDEVEASLQAYLSRKYGLIKINEEDTSLINYLLLALKNNNKRLGD